MKNDLFLFILLVELNTSPQKRAALTVTVFKINTQILETKMIT